MVVIHNENTKIDNIKMRITTNYNHLPHTKINNKNYQAIPNRSQRLSSDTISFSSKKCDFKYSNAWYLKNKKILEQDDFSTTVFDKYQYCSFFDLLAGRKNHSQIYDLPLRLREDLKKQKTDTIIQNIPQDILDNTGLTNKELIKEIDKINTLIDIVAPEINWNNTKQKPKQKFQMKLGSKTATITRIAHGKSGCVYEIKLENCKPLALKHYHNSQKINESEGAFPELALAKKFNEDNVSDVPLLYYGNPYNGWMLSEFIDKNYTKRENGIGFLDYLNKNGLCCFDMNKGISVKGANEKIYVDFGYIRPKNSKIIPCKDVIIQDITKRINTNKYASSKEVSDLTKAQNIFLYGDEVSTDFIETKSLTSPEIQFYNETNNTIKNYILSEKEIPKETQKRLQKLYKSIGGIGNACILIKSCKQ